MHHLMPALLPLAAFLQPRAHHPSATHHPPKQVYTLGGSVTRGLGASRPEHNYANRFFSLINATFPHRWAADADADALLRGWMAVS